MAHDLPDAKLVVMLRDPVERAFSAYKHEFARGFESEDDFYTALQLEPNRLAGEVDKIGATSTTRASVTVTTPIAAAASSPSN